MRTAPVVIAAALAAGAVVTGCSKDGSILGIPGIERFLPKVSFKKFNVREIDFQHVDTDFVLQVDNPNPLRVAMSSFSWALELGGVKFLSGKNPDGIALEASGSSKIKLPVSVVFTDLVESVGAMKGKDEVPFQFSGKMGFNTPLGEVALPYQAGGKFPVLHTPKVAFERVRLDNFDLLRQSATIAIDLGISHEQASALNFAGFDYGLTLGDHKILEGVIADLATVQPGTTKTVSLPVTVNLVAVGATIFEAITKGGKVQVGLDAKVDVGTPFGVVPLAIDETGRLSVER
ncbi:MAG: LEA type 2 family protein [Alphaproteobacteria bacterium]|nr:LEA type 2 family protein [Alphaproteobacteria bacterium]